MVKLDMTRDKNPRSREVKTLVSALSGGIGKEEARTKLGDKFVRVVWA